MCEFEKEQIKVIKYKKIHQWPELGADYTTNNADYF